MPDLAIIVVIAIIGFYVEEHYNNKKT